MPVDKAESIKLEFAVAIAAAIKSRGLSREAIAAILHTSPAWVTKVLRGDVNLTIESMAKLCNAVGLELQINVVARRGAGTALVMPPVNSQGAPPTVQGRQQAGTDAGSGLSAKKPVVANRGRTKRHSG